MVCMVWYVWYVWYGMYGMYGNAISILTPGNSSCIMQYLTEVYGSILNCQNYTEQYKGAAAHTVTTRLQYTKVRAGGIW
jgi:hypothetical protein